MIWSIEWADNNLITIGMLYCYVNQLLHKLYRVLTYYKYHIKYGVLALIIDNY